MSYIIIELILFFILIIETFIFSYCDNKLWGEYFYIEDVEDKEYIDFDFDDIVWEYE